MIGDATNVNNADYTSQFIDAWNLIVGMDNWN